MATRRCFFIAPLEPPGSEIVRRSERLYQFVVQPAAHDAGYEPVRADGRSGPGPITAPFIRLLLDADVVVADLSRQSPTVMYAIGIRHATGRPVIHLASDGDPVPFDVASVRTIVYDLTTPAGAAPAYEQLTRALRDVDGEAVMESPVTAAMAVDRLDLVVRSPEERSTGVDSAVVDAVRALDSRLANIERRLPLAPDAPQVPQYSRKIFIVHGHDEGLKNELARFLSTLEFEPVILHEQPDRGQTIFSKLDREMRDVGFAFILLTPDDVGAVAAQRDALQPRARQNVVFEHGFFAGYLSPARVCGILRGDVELPSDLHGVVYKTVAVTGSFASIAFELAKELKAAGYIVDANRLLPV
jgi:predicted nucleotide-binding protein